MTLCIDATITSRLWCGVRLSVCLAVSLPLAALAQSGPAPQPSGKPALGAQRIPTQRNPVCTSILGKPIEETDIKAAIGIIRSAKVDKDEYETTAAHRARLPKAAELAMQGLREQFGTDRIVLGQDIKWTSYNADAGRLRLADGYDANYLHFMTNGFEGNGYWKAVVGKEENIERTTYEATNGFGAKVTVEKMRATFYSMAFEKTPMRTLHWPPTGPVSLTMTPDIAKDLKGQLRTIFVGRPIAPYTLALMDMIRPSFRQPVDYTIYLPAVAVELECASIVDKRTGKELHVIK